MISTAEKSTHPASTVHQKTAGTSFFKKAGDESFFGNQKTPSFFKAPVQTKLTVSSPDDPQEKEADAVADKVMRMPEPVISAAAPPLPPAKPVVNEELSRKEEDEEVHAKQESPVLKKIQCKQEQEEIQPKLSASISRCCDEHVDAKADINTCSCNSHNQEKNNVSLSPSDVKQQSGRGPPGSSIPFEQTLASSKGSGSRLPGDTQQFMESRFSADFSGVRIHTGSEAENLSRSVNAQAFAHGNDIYFNSGKFSPGSTDGRVLLAHELTHTIQQGASKTSGNANNVSTSIERSQNARPANDLIPANNNSRIHSKRGPPHQTILKKSAEKPTTDAQNKALKVSLLQRSMAGKSGRVQRLPSLGDVWDATGGKVVSGVKAAGEFVGDVASDVIEWTGEKLEALVNELAPGLITFLRGDIIGTIKDSISSAIDSLTGGLFSQIQTEGLTSILQQLFGSALGSLGQAASQTCSAIADVAGKLWAFVKQLTGPALEGFKNMASKIGNFFSSVWNDFAIPAWDAIKKFAGSAWTWMVDKATWLWDLTGPVRSAIGAAWNWVCKQFGIAWSGASSVIDWLKEKAAKAWDWVKSAIEPIIGPLKIIGGILLMLSPAGPIILIYKAAPYVWDAIQWLATNFNKYVISTAKEYLHTTILPAIQSGIEVIKGLIMSGFAWVKSLFDSLLGGISGVLSAIAGLSVFKFLQGAIQSMVNGIRTAFQTVTGVLAGMASALAGAAAKVWETLKPIAEMVRQLIMVAVLGPFAILDDGVWNTLNTIVNIGMKIPCVRELEGLLQVPWLMKQFDAFRKMMKGIYEMIKNPQPIIDDIKKAVGGLIAKVAPKAKAAIQLVLGAKNAHHLEGIMRHLEPKLTYLAAHWWEVVKETGWDMLWPWPAFGKDCEQLWIKGKSMFSNFFHLHFSKGIDDGLAIFRLVNSLAGHLYGWFAIASVLIGTVIGAFFGGGGAIPGFWAGVGVAVEAGEVLMVGMLAAEGASIQKSVFDLGVTNETEAEEEEDYEQISSSGLNLGIMGAMIVLGELAVKFGKSLLGSVKGLFKARGAPPEVVPVIPGEAPKVDVDVPGGGKADVPEVKGGTPEVKGDTPEVKGDTPEVKGDTPEVKGDTPAKDLGTEGGKKVLAEEPTPDRHKVKVTEDGECLVCSICTKMKNEYKSILEDPKPDAETQQVIKEFNEIDAMDGKANPEAKAKAEAEIRQKLETLSAKKSAAIHAQAEQLPTKIYEAIEKAKKLPDNNPAKREILNELEALKEQADTARELANENPKKAGDLAADVEAIESDFKKLEQKIKEIDPVAVTEEPAYVKENRVPKPNETVLADGARFERTGNNYQGQQIFREKSTGNAFHMDGLHKGASAEIEVFSGTAEGSPHLGTVTPQGAPLDGPIKGRTLRISR